MNTIENNKLIAEFLGAVSNINSFSEESLEYDMFGIIPDIQDGENEKHYFSPDEMLFRYDFNWIMQVVLVIESIVAKNEKDYSIVVVSIEGNFCEIYLICEKSEVITSIESTSKLESIYLACIEFIKHYNQNKEKFI